MSDHDVPRGVRALWGESVQGRRGPKPALTVPSIAAAAIEVADGGGLGAVSMAAVAKQLGYTTMSLYRYLDSKDDLLLVMLDVALGPPPKLDAHHGWRGQMEEWVRAETARLGAHPWTLDVRVDSPPLGPNSLAWMEAGLKVLGAAGLSPDQAASSLLLLDGYARHQVLMAQQYADREATGLWAERLRSLADPERYPILTAALAAGVFDEDAGAPAFPADEYDFGLGLLLDGVAGLAAAGGGGAR